MSLSRTHDEITRRARRPHELAVLVDEIADIMDAVKTVKEQTEKPAKMKSEAVSLGPAKKPVPTGKTKTCTKCKLPKGLDRFPPHPDTVDGKAAWCKDCRAVLRKRRGENNMVARLKHHFAARMTQQLQDAGVKETPPLVLEMESYLGYRMDDLVRYLGDDIQEREGITLKQAFDKGYHIDHITPLSKFPFGTIGDEMFRRCWAMDNLRVIPAGDNLKKGAEDIFEDSE